MLRPTLQKTFFRAEFLLRQPDSAQHSCVHERRSKVCLESLFDVKFALSTLLWYLRVRSSQAWSKKTCCPNQNVIKASCAGLSTHVQPNSARKNPIIPCDSPPRSLQTAGKQEKLEWLTMTSECQSIKHSAKHQRQAGKARQGKAGQ